MKIKKNQISVKMLSLVLTVISLTGVSQMAEAVTCVCTFRGALGMTKDITLSTNKTCSALNEAKISVDGHPGSNCREVSTKKREK